MVADVEARKRPLARIAARQYGVFSRQQAVDAGLKADAIAYRLRSGAWQQVHPRVYRIAGAPISWKQKLMAAQLWGEPGAVISHEAAGALFALSGVPSGRVSIIAHRTDAPAAIRVHRTCTLLERDYAPLGPFEVTGVVRTLIDLGSVLPPVQVEAAFEDALRRDEDRLGAIIERLSRCSLRGPGGARVLAEIVGRRDPDAACTESLAETKLEHALRDAGVPMPVRQYWVRRPDGSRARIDFAYPDHRLAIEFEGLTWHYGREKFIRDRLRAADLAALGWRVLPIVWITLLDHPELVAERVRQALAA
ncbi:MAG TPA: type IV toxin-antitoxin system AbiEi family antitoxin domain-containing protein [Actinomycetota bacterium]|nr:type IV toxin-antitoxin system AbiEi family antitoxin domain-containing protein [Actinomycetota bacterium]